MRIPRIFRYFKTSPEIIRLAVMMDVRYPLSVRTVEDLLHERGSTSRMKRSGSGGTGSGRSLRLSAGGAGWMPCVISATVAGISTRSS